MNSDLKKDLYRYCGSESRKKLWQTLLLHPGARFMFLYRMCNKYTSNHIFGLFFRIWMRFLCMRTNVEIPHATILKSGLYFGHFKNIVINQNVVIGENCNIMQGVTIGNESRGKRKGSPVIGNKVLIGPNSVVVGKIIIGNNVLIGPLTLVNCDIPDNSIVLGSPGKIVSSKGSEGYIKKVLN